MTAALKALFIDAHSGYYRIKRYEIGAFFGPADLGLHLSARHNTLNIGAGLLAGSIFPGSNRLIFSGFSPCWGGFYISSMGGAGLVFDNLGLFAVGIIWMLIHIIVLLVVAKLIKAPFFFVAVGSQANVGGAASAPVVASAFSPSLAPVGVLLAVLGYALGTYAALFCAWLMEWVVIG